MSSSNSRSRRSRWHSLEVTHSLAGSKASTAGGGPLPWRPGGPYQPCAIGSQTGGVQVLHLSPPRPAGPPVAHALEEPATGSVPHDSHGPCVVAKMKQPSSATRASRTSSSTMAAARGAAGSQHADLLPMEHAGQHTSILQCQLAGAALLEYWPLLVQARSSGRIGGQ